MFNLFGWLRAKARDAVIGGVSDALAVLTPPADDPPPDLEALRARLAAAAEPKQLPAPAGQTAAEPAEPGDGDAVAGGTEKAKGKKAVKA